MSPDPHGPARLQTAALVRTFTGSHCYIEDVAEPSTHRVTSRQALACSMNALGPRSFTARCGLPLSVQGGVASLGLLLKAAASTVRRSVVVYFAAISAKLSKAARSQISKIVASVPSEARNLAVQTVCCVQPTVSRSNDQALSKARARNSFAAKAALLKNRFSKVTGISSGLERATIKGPLGRKAIITISVTRPRAGRRRGRDSAPARHRVASPLHNRSIHEANSRCQ